LSYKNNPETSELRNERSGCFRFVLVRALLAALGILTSAAAHGAQFSVDAVKAAYLFRFAQYVEWPHAPPEQPFVFAVSGAEDVAVHLERLLAGMTVNGRRATVRRITRSADLTGVHVLFVGADAFARTRTLRAGAIRRPILLVTENEHGLDGGGVINFIEVDRNLRFEISLNAADRSGLRINSALLSVAARVERRPQGAVNCLDGYPRLQRSAGCRIRMASANSVRGE
jgi:hypothetical protein